MFNRRPNGNELHRLSECQAEIPVVSLMTAVERVGTVLARSRVMRTSAKARFLLLFCSILLCHTHAAGAKQTIVDASRSVDWRSVGVAGGIPNRTTICATLNPG